MESELFPKSELNTVKRLPKRGHYDKDTVFEILDRNFLCHLAWQDEGQPYIIPTAFGRKEDVIYVHGSSKSRMLDALADGRPVCMSVMEVNGLVLARSIFHHSMNYHSVVIYGHGRLVEGDEKMEALAIVSEQIIPHRWDEVRTPSEIEMKATTVIAIHIDTASAKIRTGPPGDDAEDYALPVWAGVLPLSVTPGTLVADPLMTEQHPVPKSVQEYLVKK